MSLSNKNPIVPAILILIIALFPTSCAKIHVERPVYEEVGLASWYGPGFQGRKTACGEWYNQNKFTAAHKNLPFGTKLKVTNLSNDKSVVVRVNDRGPYARRRIIDLSKAAAKELGFVRNGITKVKIEFYSEKDAPAKEGV